MSTSKRFLSLIAALAVALLPSLASAQLYKWVDDTGVTNYSSAPPPGRSSLRVDDESDRVSTIPAYDYPRGDPANRDSIMRDRIDRLEAEMAHNRQTAAMQEAAAQEAYRQWREQCIAQRRTDCDDPYPNLNDPGYYAGSAPYSPSFKPIRPPPGTFRPTPKFATGGGGVVGPFFLPPPGGIATGAGPYGIGAGLQPAPPGGVVVAPGSAGIGASYYPVPPPRPPALMR